MERFRGEKFGKRGPWRVSGDTSWTVKKRRKKKFEMEMRMEAGFSPSISETVRRIHDVRYLLRQVFFTASRLAVCDSFLCPLRKLLLLRVRNLLTLRFSLSRLFVIPWRKFETIRGKILKILLF